MLRAAWLWSLGLGLQRAAEADIQASKLDGAAGRLSTGPAAGGCAAAMMESTCGDKVPAECDICAGQKQHLLRAAGCSAAQVSAWCTGLPVGATELYVVEGRLQPGGQYIGMYTSQLQALVDGSFSPKSAANWRDMSLVNSSVLRHLHLQGAYLADVSLSLPSLFVLKLTGSITPASNLSRVNTSRYQALVQMADVHFSAVIGGTFDGSMLPAMPSTYDPVTKTTTRHGYMALSIQGGGNNAIRAVRAMSNNSDAVIGVNMSPRAEIGNCEVGGDAGALGMLKTRCIWTLATSHALVHDNHVHHCSSHALDFDAYTSNSVAWNNLCEDNGEEGIFVEETAQSNSVFNNTCRRNSNGIGVYANAVGPVTNNIFINNRLYDNRNYGLTAGGYGHAPDKMSLANTFAGNVVSNNELGNPSGAASGQINPAHGAVSLDYWTANEVVGPVAYDTKHALHNSSALMIFEPA